MCSTEFSITNRGDLRITLTTQGPKDAERVLTNHPDWDEVEFFIELIDGQLSSEWYIVPPAQIRALTLSLILANSVTYDEHGEIIQIGQAYWYPESGQEPYATRLINEGQLIFMRAEWSAES